MYSIAINTYQRMTEIEAALDALLGAAGADYDITDEEYELLMVLIYEAVLHG